MENKELATELATATETKTVALVEPETDKQQQTQLPVERFQNVFHIETLLNTAGTLELTKEQEEILFAPVNEADVEIRPDGLIYLPWMEYVTRLRKSFGCNWAIIPNGNPLIKGNIIIWGFYLIIKGKLMGFALGEQEYQPTNATMSYTDACEGAKSNALMRLCKGIGISLELWKPSFIRQWKEKYAYSYTIKGRLDKWGNPKLFWKKGNKNTNQNNIPDKTEITEPDTSDNDKDTSLKVVCDKCGIPINGRVANYSFEKYKKLLCFDCQKKENK